MPTDKICRGSRVGEACLASSGSPSRGSLAKSPGSVSVLGGPRSDTNISSVAHKLSLESDAARLQNYRHEALQPAGHSGTIEARAALSASPTSKLGRSNSAWALRGEEGVEASPKSRTSATGNQSPRGNSPPGTPRMPARFFANGEQSPRSPLFDKGGCGSPRSPRRRASAPSEDGGFFMPRGDASPKVRVLAASDGMSDVGSRTMDSDSLIGIVRRTSNPTFEVSEDWYSHQPRHNACGSQSPRQEDDASSRGLARSASDATPTAASPATSRNSYPGRTLSPGGSPRSPYLTGRARRQSGKINKNSEQWMAPVTEDAAPGKPCFVSIDGIVARGRKCKTNKEPEHMKGRLKYDETQPSAWQPLAQRKHAAQAPAPGCGSPRQTISDAGSVAGSPSRPSPSKSLGSPTASPMKSSSQQLSSEFAAAVHPSTTAPVSPKYLVGNDFVDNRIGRRSSTNCIEEAARSADGQQMHALPRDLRSSEAFRAHVQPQLQQPMVRPGCVQVMYVGAGSSAVPRSAVLTAGPASGNRMCTAPGVGMVNYSPRAPGACSPNAPRSPIKVLTSL